MRWLLSAWSALAEQIAMSLVRFAGEQLDVCRKITVLVGGGSPAGQHFEAVGGGVSASVA